MFIKKIPNVITAQRILKPSLLVLIIAGSRFLPNASAMRWIFNFEGKQIKASEFNIYTEMLNFGDENPIPETGKGKYKPTMDWLLEYYSFVKKQTEGMRTNRLKREDKEDGESEITIVLKNGTLDVEEAEKLLYGVRMSFNIEFINCRGTLDLNENLKENANLILFQDCNFETAPDCFKNAKHLKFSDTTLTPKNGRLGFDENASIDFHDSFAFVFSKNMQLENAIALEFAAQNPNKKQENVSNNVIESKENSKTEINLQTEGVKEKLLSLQTGCDSLNKELEEIKRNNKDGEQYKLKVTKLEKEVKDKDLIIENLKAIIKNLKAEVERLENNEKSIRKELSKTIQNKNTEQKVLSSTQKQLEDAKHNNETYKATIGNMKERNERLKKENEKLSKKQRCTEGYAKGLEALKEELEKEKEELEEENDALKGKIQKSSEAVQLAEKAIEENKKLKKTKDDLTNAKEKANDEIGKLKKDIKTLKKLFEIAIEWANYNVSLMDKMKERGTISSIKAFLGEADYWKKQQEIKKKLEGNEGSKNLKTKKGKWLEFDPNESKEEEEAKGESEKESKDYFEIKTDNYFKGNGFQEKNDCSRGFEWNKRGSRYHRGRGVYRGNYRGSENQGNYRGRYQNNFRGARGEMIVNNPRGRGHQCKSNY